MQFEEKTIFYNKKVI